MEKLNADISIQNANTPNPLQDGVNSYFRLKNATKTKPSKDEFVSPKDKKDKKQRSKKAKIALYVAGGVSLLGILISPKFLPKSFTSKISNATKKIFGDAAEKMKPLTSRANVMNNFNTAKDAAVGLACDYIKPLGWIRNKTSPLYGDIANKTLEKKFNKAFKALDGTYTKILDEMRAKGLDTKTMEEMIEKSQKLTQEYFGGDARKKFVQQLDEIFDGIDKKWRDKAIELAKNKEYSEFFENFIIKDMVEPDKVRLMSEMLEKTDEIIKCNDEISKIARQNGINTELLFNKANGKLLKANYVQCGDFFDKIRDIKANAAPSDALGIITSAAGLGFYVTQAKTKEGRISAALTTGIPLGLGVVASLIATMGMVSGFGAIAIGGAATMVSGILGKALDKAYKKHHGIDDKKSEIPTLDIPDSIEIPTSIQ